MTTTSQRPPNILLLLPDQWRWDWLGCEDSPYGKVPVRTPHIDAIAARGVRFTQCRTNSPLCAPARACLALGMRYENCGVPGNGHDLEPHRTNVFHLLQRAGYRTLTCGKNDLHKKTQWKGRAGWTQLLGSYGFSDAIDQSGKFDAARNGTLDMGGPNCAYTSYLHSHGLFEEYRADYQRRRQEATDTTAPWPSPLPREHHTDDFCGRMGLELLDRTPCEEPWMLWVNFPGPHDPFDPPRELQQRYDGVAFPPPVHGSDSYRDKPVDHQQVRRNYAASCEGIDEWVGRLLDRVAQRGELDRTVVVFASDHGEMLGDHCRFVKNVAYEGSVHVPLVVAGPGIEAGRVRDDLVELIDVSATMLNAAGLEVPDDWDAQPLFGPGHSPRPVQHSALGSWRMVFDGRYKLIVEQPEPSKKPQHAFEDGALLALFDLQDYPTESRNLAADKPDIVARLMAAMQSSDAIG